jgi:acyl dehydratase
MLIQTAQVSYRTGDRLIASAVASTFRVPRRGAESGLSYEPRDEYVYTQRELDDIRRDALNEFRRGAEPLVFSDVSVGDLIPGVVKGPIDRITMTAYYAGCIGSPGYKACELAWKYRDWAEHSPERLPSNYDPSYFAETVLPSLGHQDGDVAQEIGMPNAYDNGPQRCGWFGHAVTNWMGDRSFLHRLRVRLRRPDIFGDTVWISGSIVGLREAGSVGIIEIELRARNQLGDQVADGGAEVLCSLDPEGPPPTPGT